jgi:hypothetical protein
MMSAFKEKLVPTGNPNGLTSPANQSIVGPMRDLCGSIFVCYRRADHGIVGHILRRQVNVLRRIVSRRCESAKLYER